MVAAGEMLAGGMSLAFAHIGDKVRRMRRALHTHLQPKVAGEYEPLQMSEAKNMVLNILDDPSNFRNHTVTYAATTIMKIAYGKNTPTAATDPEVIEVHRLIAMSRTIMSSGTYLVESIPWLKYLPWYGRELKRGYESIKQLNTNQLNHVKQQMQSNVDIGPSFAKYVLENGHRYGMSRLTELEMASLAGTFFSSGSGFYGDRHGADGSRVFPR
ncbi:hypothetical protein AZE42_11262 [Rhizopogon vesiculosus]|uniref:Cytochrome P450 n=1 Tax=Rhizopogon vesiculosus TaxID=180088 RepID=A0A1J8Q4V0_9AGAM|nr:hypothetical protein AZE42_11262 [Rhizopogon vesiculosus]